MKSITTTELSQGSGTAKAIEQGSSMTITRDGEPVALYRPYREGDRGEKVNATTLYAKVPKFVGRVEKGKSVIVLRRGEPFATICKYEKPKAKARKSRPKRRPKTAAKRRPKTPTPQVETPTEADEPVPHRHHASAELLKLADMLPPGLEVELMTRGASLHERGKLEKGLHLLELLDEGKLEEALSGLRLLMD